MDQYLRFLWLIPLAFFAGTYGTLIGAGGGFVLAPALLLLYPGEAPEIITSISLRAVFFNALSGTLARASSKRIDYKSRRRGSLSPRHSPSLRAVDRRDPRRPSRRQIVTTHQRRLDHPRPRLYARLGRSQTFCFIVVVEGFSLSARKTYYTGHQRFERKLALRPRNPKNLTFGCPNIDHRPTFKKVSDGYSLVLQ